jgi:hypothetical protein
MGITYVGILLGENKITHVSGKLRALSRWLFGKYQLPKFYCILGFSMFIA